MALSRKYTIAVNLASQDSGVVVSSIGLSTVNVTGVGLLTGPRGADSTVPGPPGTSGAPGTPGAPGIGIPTGGGAGQVLKKHSGADYDTGWVDPIAVITGITLTDTDGKEWGLGITTSGALVTTYPADNTYGGNYGVAVYA